MLLNKLKSEEFSNHLAGAQIPASPGRIPGLDGLRAFSIMIVISGHFLLKDEGGFAALGVYIFFAISGFLITRLLFLEKKKSGRADLLQFYVRRVLRLYPVLIVYIVVVSIVDHSRGIPTPPLEILSVFFYFVNYLITWNTIHGQALSMPIGVLWSLSVEEHFYLIMPLFFVAVSGRLRPMLYFSIAALVLPLVIRCSYLAIWPEIAHKLITYRNSETRFDSIAVGMLLAVICECKIGRRIVPLLASRPAFVICILLFVTAAIPGSMFRETFRFTTLSIASGILLVAIVFSEDLPALQKIVNLPAIVWVGRISYSLYIWHGCLVFFLQPYANSLSPISYKLSLFVIVFGISSLSYYFVEQPALRLKKLPIFRPRSRNTALS